MRLTFSLCCWLFSVALLGQQAPDCDDMLRQAKNFEKNNELSKAVKFYLNALNCNTALSGEIGPRLKGVFEKIEEQKKREELARKEADRARADADEQKNLAQQSARRSFANVLAFKSQALLQAGDRTTAFRLAELAYQLVDTNNNVVKALLESFYCNENSDGPFLPWVERSFNDIDNEIYALSFSEDGKLLNVVCGDGGRGDWKLTVWNRETGMLVNEYTDVESLWSHAVSANGKYLAVIPKYEGLGILDLGNLKISEFSGSHQASLLDFSLDGQYIACDDNHLEIRHCPENSLYLDVTKYYTDYEQIPKDVAFLPDNRLAAISKKEGGIDIWDLESKEFLYSFNSDTMVYQSITCSPNGNLMAACTNNLNAIEVWDLVHRRKTTTIQCEKIAPQSERFIQFSPQGKYLQFEFTPGEINVYEPRNREIVSKLENCSKAVFSHDDKWLAVALNDKNAVEIWDLDNRRKMFLLIGHNGPITAMAFSPDNLHLATGSSDKSVKIWNLLEFKQLRLLPDSLGINITDIQYAPDGNNIVLGYKEGLTRVINVENNSLLMTVLPNLSSKERNRLEYTDVAFTCDSKHIGTIPAYNKITRLSIGGMRYSDPLKWMVSILNIDNGKTQNIDKRPGINARELLFSPDDKFIFLKKDTAVECIEIAHDSLMFSIEIYEPNIHDYTAIYNMALSPDGKYLAIVYSHYDGGSGGIRPSGEFKVWNLLKGSAPPIVEKYEDQELNSLIYSPDGKWLAIAGQNGEVQLWSTATYDLTFTMKGHQSAVESICFLPGSRRLVSQDIKGQMKVWDIITGEEILTLQSSALLPSIMAVSPVEQEVATLIDSIHLAIWDLDPKRIIEKMQEHPLGALSSRQMNILQLAGVLDVFPENKAKIMAGNDMAQVMEWGNYFYESATRSADLRRTRHDYARAAQFYKQALNTTPTNFISRQLGVLYDIWARNILESARPDTAIHYIQQVCEMYGFATYCPDLWDLYAEKTGKSYNFNNLFLASDSLQSLIGYGDYFFRKKSYKEARLLYVKSESIQHIPEVVEKIYECSLHLDGRADAKVFLQISDPDELITHGEYFFKQNNTPTARILYEKSDSIQHSAKALEGLYNLSEADGEPFDFNRFLNSTDTLELKEYAQFFDSKVYSFDARKNAQAYKTHCLLICERALQFDTTSSFRQNVSIKYADLARDFFYKQNIDSAQILLHRALELNPQNGNAHRFWAHCLLFQNKFDAAKVEYLALAPLVYKKPFSPGKMIFKDAFLEDFAGFKTRQLPIPRLDEMEAWLLSLELPQK